MKSFYKLLISVIAILSGSAGCMNIATDYGAQFPENYDENVAVEEENEFFDEDTENPDDEKYEIETLDADSDEFEQVQDENQNNNDQEVDDNNIDENNNDSDIIMDNSCPDSNKFCHVHQNINWSDVSKGKRWDVAVKYCEDIEGRLPTISEFRTLVQNCPATETGGECKVTDECLSYSDCWTSLCNGCGNFGDYSVFGHTDTFWSSSERTYETVSIWVIDFQYGSIFDYYTDTTQPFSVICVEK